MKTQAKEHLELVNSYSYHRGLLDATRSINKEIDKFATYTPLTDKGLDRITKLEVKLDKRIKFHQKQVRKVAEQFEQ